MIILCVVLTLFFLILLAVRIRELYLVINGKDINKDTRYKKPTFEIKEDVIKAVYDGEIKKHLLPNDAPKYDSSNFLENYISFIRISSLSQKIKTIKEERFYG